MLVKELTIIAEDQTFTYDGTSHPAPASAVPSEGAQIDITYATSKDGKEYSPYSPDVPTITDAGTLYIKAKATKGTQTKEASYTATVNKRHVIITSDSASKAYNGQPLTKHNYTISGDEFVSGQGIKSGSVSYTGSQTDVGSSENSFSYELDSETTKAENYNISKELGTLTVTPCASTIAITTGSSTAAYNGTALTCSEWSGTYGDTPIAPSSGSSQYLLETDDTLIVTCTGSITDVGSTQNTCTYRVERKDKGDDVTANYSFAETTCGTLTVTQRSVVINTASANKIYDGDALTAKSYTVSGDGFITGEDFEDVNIVGTITNVGNVPNLLDSTTPYTFKDGTNPANYKISVKPGTLTVEKRKVTVTSGSAVTTAPDDATNPNVSHTGFVTGEVTLETTGKQSEVTTDINQPKIADNTVSYTWHSKAESGTPTNDGNPANYEITENLGKLVKVDRSLTYAVASDYVGTYDGQPHKGTFSSNIPNPVKTVFSYDGGSNWQTTEDSFTDVVTAKEVKIRVWINDSSYAECSYKVTINQRPVTLTAGSASKVYDGTYLTCADYTVGCDGLVSGENPKIEMTDGSTVKDVADSPVNNVIDQEKLKTGVGAYKYSNYKFTTNPGSLQVTKRPLILRSNPIGVTEKPSNQVTGFVMPDAELLSNNADKDALLHTQNVYKQIAGLSNAAEIYNELQMPDTEAVKYDGDSHSDTTVVEVGKDKIPDVGFVEGEGASYSDSFSSFIDAGTYMNTFKIVTWNAGTTASNYDPKTIYAPVTIDKRDVTLTSATDFKIYDETPLTNNKITESGDGFVKDKGEGATYNVTGSQTKIGESSNTFTYTLYDGKTAGQSETKAGNYNITTIEGTLKVVHSEGLKITVPESKTYTFDRTPHGEKATATKDGNPYDGTIWYSVDGGKTYNSTYPRIVGAGTVNVKAFVDEYGYARSEGVYSITVVNPDTPSEESNPVVDVNQEDLNNAAETYIQTIIDEYREDPSKEAKAKVKELTGCGKCAWIEAEAKATENPEDMAKLQQAAPGKNFKYADVRLYCSAWDEDGNFIDVENESGETVTLDGVDIGDRNPIPIGITYKADMTNTQDVECLRVHNGEVGSLPQGAEAAVEGEYWQMGPDQQSVMVAASKYSTYAVAYNVPGGDANATGTGATGDNMSLAICLLGLLMSCCAAYALVYKRRRKDN